MQLAIYVQQKFYRIMDLGPTATEYNYGNVASQISHEMDRGLMEGYDPKEHFQLRIVPLQE